MENITEKEKQLLALAAKMLDLASDTFSNHGCNDLSDDVLNLITDEKGLCDAMREWNGDPDGECPENKHFISDWMLMHFLSDYFKTLTQNIKP